MRPNFQQRRGMVTLEFAIVSPVAILLILGPIIGGLGVFRYQQVAALAREASRYASVHGTQYAKNTTGHVAATAQDITDLVKASAVGLDLSKLNCSTIWNTSNSPFRTSATAYQILELTNTVKVTVSYQWGPEAFWGGITMTSTSESPMWY